MRSIDNNNATRVDEEQSCGFRGLKRDISIGSSTKPGHSRQETDEW